MQTTTSAGSSTARRNVLVLAGAAVMAAGCSGPTEDVRVTLCKNLTTTLQSAQSIEWKGNENSFRRPEYAITALTYEALEDTAVTLADPLSAYANLPFAMTFNGRTLSDAELLQLVNAEQRRQGRQAVETLKKGARDVADKVREKISQ